MTTIRFGMSLEEFRRHRIAQPGNAQAIYRRFGRQRPGLGILRRGHRPRSSGSRLGLQVRRVRVRDRAA